MLGWLIKPLSYGFMWRGLLAAMMVGGICSVLGCYVILQGMAFFGDALAHTILPGVVIAYLVGWPLAVGALIFGILSAVGIGALSQRGEVREDTAIGVIFAGSFALGVAMLSTVRSYAVDLAHILFGDVLGVSSTCCSLSFSSIRNFLFWPLTPRWQSSCVCRSRPCAISS
jgi:ABC-type Mn2+/Zn2+ transport system permease subunit